MDLSVCIITKNEEKNIFRCLKSIEKIADEILILDSYSEDNTVKICKMFTSKIFFHTWEEDFSFSRNLIKSKALGKWILFIDADETFSYTEDFKSQLKTSKKIAFLLNRNEIYKERKTNKICEFPVGMIRLFKNDSEIQYRYSIHERVDDTLKNHLSNIRYNNKCQLNHHILYQQEVHLINKQTKYLTNIQNELEKVPNSQWMLFQKIKTLLFLQQYEECLSEINSLISQNVKLNHKVKIAISVIKSQILKQTDLNQAIKLLEKEKSCTVINYFLGDYYYEKGNFYKALFCYLLLNTNKRTIKYADSMYLISFVTAKTKIYKIMTALYSLKLYNLTLFLDYVLQVKSSEIFMIKSLIYLKRNELQKAHFFLMKARLIDNSWTKLIEIESYLKTKFC